MDSYSGVAGGPLGAPARGATARARNCDENQGRAVRGAVARWLGNETEKSGGQSAVAGPASLSAVRERRRPWMYAPANMPAMAQRIVMLPMPTLA